MNLSRAMRKGHKMNRLIRRVAIGTIAGIVASIPLTAALSHIPGVVMLGAVLGVGYAVLTGPTPGAYLDNMLTGGAYGIPLWAVISIIALPLASGQMPEWSAEQMRSHFPLLVGWVLYGVTLGLCTQFLNDLATRLIGSEPVSSNQDSAPT